MTRSDWKERIGRVPVLGNLLAAARGVWSLRVWREELRVQGASLLERTDALERRLQESEARSAQALAALEDALAALRRERGEEARRIEERLDEVAQRQARYAQTLFAHERRLGAASAELRHGLAQVRRVAARQALEGPGTLPAPPRPGCPLAPQPAVRLAGPDGPPELAPFRHLLAVQAGVGAAQAVLLPPSLAQGWADGLRALDAGSLAAVVAPSGAGALTRAELDALLDAAAHALRPDGVLALAYANPENAQVADRLVVAAAGATVWNAPLLERCVRDAGFGDVAVIRYEADDEAHRLPGEGAGIERLNQWLFGPRRFAVHARRAA